jgi:hypothetical protein
MRQTKPNFYDCFSNAHFDRFLGNGTEFSRSDGSNKLCPDFGTRFKRDFCGGNRLLISGLRNQSRNDLVKAREFDVAGSDWYNSNRHKINEVFVAALE